jgi:hypothetical protein
MGGSSGSSCRWSECTADVDTTDSVSVCRVDTGVLRVDGGLVSTIVLWLRQTDIGGEAMASWNDGGG